MATALILAAGEATRLRPLTKETPKCLLTLGNKSILDWQLCSLRQCGVYQYSVAVGHAAEKIQERGHPTFTNHDYRTTNMAETLFRFLDANQISDDLLISYGDIIYQPENVKKILATEADVAVMVDLNWRSLWEARMDSPLDDAETLKMDENGNLLELGNQPHSYDDIEAQYTGLIKIASNKINALRLAYADMKSHHVACPISANNLYMTAFLQYLINQDWNVKACCVEGGWLELDTIEDHDRYNQMFADGSIVQFIRV